MKKISLLLCVGICVFQIQNSFSQNNSIKPNVIVIMVDDMGYNDVGFNGCQDIPTPNIDRIATEGVKFTNGYTSYSVCGPSRAGFMTGRYGQRFGFERNPQYSADDPNMGLPKEEKTIAEHLSTVGYTSGIIGKWHLGTHISNHPLNRGFDEFYGHLGGGHRYFPENLVIKDSYFTGEEVLIPAEDGIGKPRKVSAEIASYQTRILRNHTPIKTSKYLTEEFSDEAVKFVERNKNEQFFLFLSYNAPHTPLQATQKYLDRFPNIENKKRKTYAAMVSAVDDGVGNVLDKLKELDLEKNTLVFFLSDNGGPETKNGSNNGILREGKGSIYEGGFRVPFAVQWKGVLESGVYDFPISSLDILGTIASLTGVKIDKEKPLDGVHLIPYLQGKKTGAPHQNIYLRKFDQDLHTVRDGDLKLVVKWKGSKKELYNLKNDIGEKINIANQYPKQVKRLHKILLEWESELIEPTFLGLIHTPAWVNKAKKKKKKKK
ncbi:MAG: N-acetylgalactosamine 6-sulfate sulfatase [Flavobacteriaceae bacterium]|nr:MAG: N-acetylgalactosamine 6-sulfate sulfatase [Flavobacteriaceae bacterium]